MDFLIHVRRFDIDYVAHLQRFVGTSEIGESNQFQNSRVAFGHGATHPSQVILRERPMFIPHSGCEQQAVFIEIVKFAELPEQIIPTFVWFERVDAFNRLFPRHLYFSTVFGRHVFVGGIGDGEGNVVGGNLGSDPFGDQCVNQVIESAPEVIESVSNYDGDRKGNFRHTDDFKNLLSRLRITLKSNELAVSLLMEDSECFGEISDVLIGPFGL